MSPRRNRPRRDERPGTAPADGPRYGTPSREDGYIVRPVGGQMSKTYRCPGCDHEIPPGVPHVVAWPDDGLPASSGPDHRRHWHTSCWRARHHRRPTGRP